MDIALSDATAKSNADGTYSLFFFGTLVHPAILSKIIENDGAHLSVQPAILPGYVIHHVVNEDYPGLVARNQSDLIMSRKGTEKANGVIEEQVVVAEAVRGTVVRGLTAMDVRKLDIFEGDEYIRVGVQVRADSAIPACSNDKRPRDESIGEILSSIDANKIAIMMQNEPEEFANVYLWRSSVERLEPRIWDFAAFTKSGKDRRWYA